MIVKKIFSFPIHSFREKIEIIHQTGAFVHARNKSGAILTLIRSVLKSNLFVFR